MNSATILAAALDPSRIMAVQGLKADAWQQEFLFSSSREILLNCSRGAGKSRVTSALALHTALFRPGSLILLVSRSLRQSTELFRYVKQGFRALERPLDAVKDNDCQLELANGSRIVALPGREETIRSFQGVNLLILDEAARIPEELFSSVSPMTGVSRGRTVCLSTPFGPSGFFWREWHNDGVKWTRFRVTWHKCPRLTSDFIENERRKFGDAWIRQEYECSFETRHGLVYPDFSECLIDPLTPTPLSADGETENRVGGIDFGFRNPFAALWGFLDRDDVLHIMGEIYEREKTLDVLAGLLPRGVIWHADPAGAGDIAQLKRRDHCVKRGFNDLRLGIQAVTARIRTGRLKVDAKRCPLLVREAQLYHYAEDGTETPVDSENHALAALRYLVAGLDVRRRVDAGHAEPAKKATSENAMWELVD